MQIYWDRLAVADTGETPAWKRHELKLHKAQIDDVGFSVRTLLEQRYPLYNYASRPPLADARHPAGFYTALGDARQLVNATDNAVAIIGPGEELHLEYETPEEQLPTGWSRTYVLEADGWCKDADPFTKDSGTVKPLPVRKDIDDELTRRRRDRLHRKYNTRFKSGY